MESGVGWGGKIAENNRMMMFCFANAFGTKVSNYRDRDVDSARALKNRARPARSCVINSDCLMYAALHSRLPS